MKKRSLRHFFSLTIKRKLLYFEALFFLLYWHVIGRILPLTWYKRFFGKRIKQAPPITHRPPSVTAMKIGYVVYHSAQMAPWKPVCYPQALAAKSMLRNRKMASTLYFGAAIGGNEKLVRLHCWLAHQDTIITGKRGHQDYKVIQVYA
jgi:hypothetical protein